MIFQRLMSAEDIRVKDQLSDLIENLKRKTPKSLLDNTVLRVHNEYPGDVGVFCLYILNVIQLNPGEAVFLGPNEPHAYLEGDCVECTATSDNVVRAGLTPKYKDVDTLVSMLTYQTESPSIYRGTLSKQGGFICKEYLPPIEEFQIRQFELPALAEGMIDGCYGPSVYIVYQGEGKANSKDDSISLYAGSVIFVYAYTPLSITSTTNFPLIIYQATTNIKESKY